MSFPIRLKSIRIKRGLSQAQLADLIGVSARTVGCWERGSKNPTLGYLNLLIKTLNVSADYLLDVDINLANTEKYQITEEEARHILNFRKLDFFGKKAVENICNIECSRVACEKKPTYLHENTTYPTKRYILKYLFPAAAGYAAPLEGDDYEIIQIDENTPQNADYAVKISGTSMMPYINDGEVVFVDRDATISIGDVGIFNVNGETYCKQYYINKEGDAYLVSSNPSLSSSNIVIKSDSHFSIKCYGKVILRRKIPFPEYFL